MPMLTRLRRHGDVLLAGLLAVGYTIELLLFDDSRPALTVPLAIVASLSLALRRKVPLAVFVVVTAANAAVPHFARHDFDGNSIFFVAIFVINLYSLGAWARGVEAWLGVIGVLATVVVATISDGDTSPSGIFFFLFFCGLPWASGVALRLRRDKDSELHAVELAAAHETALAVAAERSRIARELHDVVSHAIAVTVLQARGARRMVGHDESAVRRALSAIEQTNTSALADMRRLLALLRDADEDPARAEPQPSLERLDQLVDQVRGSGLPVELAVNGEPLPVPPGVDLSAYRIVQEALTNVLKHGGPHARARVELSYGAEDLEVLVANSGEVVATTAGGHGLIGIRERVGVAGGVVDAGPVDGGYRVRARLPYLLGSA
jgi:signal transduction histidine kinase